MKFGHLQEVRFTNLDLQLNDETSTFRGYLQKQFANRHHLVLT